MSPSPLSLSRLSLKVNGFALCGVLMFAPIQADAQMRERTKAELNEAKTYESLNRESQALVQKLSALLKEKAYQAVLVDAAPQKRKLLSALGFEESTYILKTSSHELPLGEWDARRLLEDARALAQVREAAAEAKQGYFWPLYRSLKRIELMEAKTAAARIEEANLTHDPKQKRTLKTLFTQIFSQKMKFIAERRAVEADSYVAMDEVESVSFEREVEEVLNSVPWLGLTLTELTQPLKTLREVEVGESTPPPLTGASTGKILVQGSVGSMGFSLRADTLWGWMDTCRAWAKANLYATSGAKHYSVKYSVDLGDVSHVSTSGNWHSPEELCAAVSVDMKAKEKITALGSASRFLFGFIPGTAGIELSGSDKLTLNESCLRSLEGRFKNGFQVYSAWFVKDFSNVGKISTTGHWTSAPEFCTALVHGVFGS